MEEVAGYLNFSLPVELNIDAAAFAWVEFHLPGVFPFSESYGLLEVGLVMLVFDSAVQKAVVLQIV